MRPKTLQWYADQCIAGGSDTLTNVWRSYIRYESTLSGPRTINGLMKDLHKGGFKIANATVSGVTVKPNPWTADESVVSGVTVKQEKPRTIDSWIADRCELGDFDTPYAALWDSARSYMLYDDLMPRYSQFLNLLGTYGHKVVGRIRYEKFGGEKVHGIRPKDHYPPELDRYRGFATDAWIGMRAGYDKYHSYIFERNYVWSARRKAATSRKMCECCGKKGTQVHHVDYRWLYFERPEDLILLCRKCHESKHGVVDVRPVETAS